MDKFITNRLTLIVETLGLLGPESLKNKEVADIFRKLEILRSDSREACITRFVGVLVSDLFASKVKLTKSQLVNLILEIDLDVSLKKRINDTFLPRIYEKLDQIIELRIEELSKANGSDGPLPPLLLGLIRRTKNMDKMYLRVEDIENLGRALAIAKQLPGLENHLYQNYMNGILTLGKNNRPIPDCPKMTDKRFSYVLSICFTSIRRINELNPNMNAKLELKGHKLACHGIPEKFSSTACLELVANGSQCLVMVDIINSLMPGAVEALEYTFNGEHKDKLSSNDYPKEAEIWYYLLDKVFCSIHEFLSELWNKLQLQVLNRLYEVLFVQFTKAIKSFSNDNQRGYKNTYDRTIHTMLQKLHQIMLGQINYGKLFDFTVKKEIYDAITGLGLGEE